MIRKLFIVFIFGILVFPAFAFAQEQYGFQEGDWDLVFSGQGGSSSNFDSNNFSFQAGLGYFLRNWIELAGRQEVTYADVHNGGSAVNGSTRFAADFYVDMVRLQPYIGGNIGFVYGDNVSDGFELGVEGGAKYFVNTSTYVFGALDYLMALSDLSDGRWVYSLGLGITWR